MKNEKVTSSANLVKVKILHLSFVFLPEDVKINWQVTSSKLKSLKVRTVEDKTTSWRAEGCGRDPFVGVPDS